MMRAISSAPEHGSADEVVQKASQASVTSTRASVAIIGMLKGSLAEAEIDPARERSLLFEARDWLLDLLAGGLKPVKEIKAGLLRIAAASLSSQVDSQKLGILQIYLIRKYLI